jgi:hypothetical protein
MSGHDDTTPIDAPDRQTGRPPSGGVGKLALLPPPYRESAVSDRPLGLKLARRLDRTADLVRQVRARIRRSGVDGRKRCVRHLDRLAGALQAVEADVLSGGTTTLFSTDVRVILEETDDHLTGILDRKKPLAARHVKRLRRQVRHERKRLQALLLQEEPQHGPLVSEA